MASEATMIRVLDLLTRAPRSQIESLSAGGAGQAKSLRRIVATKNVVAVGISQKISKKRPTGTLSGFKKFVTGGDFVNGADCAIARPLDARRDELVSAIKGLGVPRGATAPVRGMRIVKVGRTTNKRRPGRSATSTSASRSTTTT